MSLIYVEYSHYLRIGVVMGWGLRIPKRLKELDNLIEDNKQKLQQGMENMEFTAPGEIVYPDNKTILTRHWNLRDSDCGIITENLTLNVLSSEAALKDISTQDLIETLCKIIEYESAFCQGTYSTFILDKMNPGVEL